ncbi:MAG: hypothetical protein KatS3mg054_0867 [Chloroflexus sp.]|nr:MAG: hypothetical protein KatS3mg054_0867 [Chloroflexus sp.]GIV92091.1 MAG: hypothetical protein KatS3mg056_0800 [Chloroflexus sp.]
MIRELPNRFKQLFPAPSPPYLAAMHYPQLYGVNHALISGYDRHRCRFGQHARVQSYRGLCASKTKRSMVAAGNVVPEREAGCANVCHHAVHRAHVVYALDHVPGTNDHLPGSWPVAARHSSRASTCWMDCLTRSSSACRGVWSAAAMLPQQPYSRSGAWHAVTHPGHGGAGCARSIIKSVRHA